MYRTAGRTGEDKKMANPTVMMPTVGEIARRLGTSVHRIEYIVRSRRIQPCGLAGNARVFTDADVSRIAVVLHRMDARRRRDV